MKKVILVGAITLLLLGGVGIFQPSAQIPQSSLLILDITMNYQDMTIYYSVSGDVKEHIKYLAMCPMGWEWKSSEFVQPGPGIWVPRTYGDDGMPAVQYQGVCVGVPEQSIPPPMDPGDRLEI